jgi:predicted small secreted protein
MFSYKKSEHSGNRSSRQRLSPRGINGQAYDQLEPRLPLTTFVVDTILDSPDGLADGQISLREAVMAANSNAPFGDAPAGDAVGDRILFSEALRGSTFTLSQGELSLTDDVLIQAGGQAITIDAAAASRHFNVTAAERVGFGGLTLINGSADQGGSISNTGGGTVLVFRTTLESNEANGDGGGAIFNQGGNVFISNDTVFSNNRASGSSGSGGAILTKSGVVSMAGGAMFSNSAMRSGGAIAVVDGQFYASGLAVGEEGKGNSAGAGDSGLSGDGGGLHASGTSTIAIRGGSISYNVAAQSAGGLWNSTDSEVFLRAGTVVSNNIANGANVGDGGGGIFNDGGDVFIRDATLSDNSASQSDGGGVLSTGGRVIAIESTFGRNRSAGSGGGIHITNSFTAFDGSTIESNHAGVSLVENQSGHGGGLYVTGDLASVILKDSVVDNNIASGDGGGIWNQAGNSMFLSGSTLISNNISQTNGGGVYTNRYFRSVDTVFEGNRSGGSFIFDTGGGGLYIDESGTARLLNGTFQGNISDSRGGGIANFGFLNVSETTFVDNIANLFNNDIHGRGVKSSIESGNLFLPPTDTDDGVFAGTFADIPVAADRTVDFYYEASTGSVFVAIGANVLVIGLEGFDFDYSQLNRDTPLGDPSQQDDEGLGFLDFTGLPVGVHDIGPILPADTTIENANQFSARFEQLVVRSGAPGEPEKRPSVFVLPVNPPDQPVEPEPDPEPSDGVFSGSLTDIPIADDGTVEFYFEAETGTVAMSVGADVLSVIVEGHAFFLDQLASNHALGQPDQLNEQSLGYLDFARLPAGVYNLGQILPADSRVMTGEHFSIRFEELAARVVAVGEVQKQASFQVLPSSTVFSGGVFAGDLSEFPAADNRSADFYYDAQTGSVLVSIGPEVLVLGLEGYPFDYGKLNRFTFLGEPQQEDDGGLGFLNFSGLPIGVYDLGPILPADELIETSAQLTDRFENLVARSGSPGDPEKRPEIMVISKEI